MQSLHKFLVEWGPAPDTVREALLDRFFKKDSPIKIDWYTVMDWEGKSLKVNTAPFVGTEGRTLRLGGGATPYSNASLTVFIHEICHLIEASDSDMFCTDWNLQSIRVARETDPYPVISNVTYMREIHTLAYQCIISDAVGLPVWFPYTLESILMSLALGANEDLHQAVSMIETIKNSHSLDWLMTEWNRKMELLRLHQSAS